MKCKIVLLFCLLIGLCVFFCSCDIDPYEGRRPDDYPNSTCYCSEYDITYSVNSEQKVSVFIEDTELSFSRLYSAFDNRVTVRFTVDDEEYCWEGRCKFGKKEFSVSFGNAQEIFGEEDVTLVFERLTIRSQAPK